jgi:hypothetical protein
MENHSKSWRGLGGFLREYVIIVVGVLTALGGQQAVDWIHQENELAETREALRDEIAQNGNVVTVSAALDRCRSAMLEKYAAWARGGPRPERFGSVGFPTLNFSVWDVAKSGPLSRMPVKERLSYSLVYDTFEKAEKDIDRQIDVAMAIIQYRYPEQLSPDQSQRLLELISAAATITNAKGRADSVLLNEVQTLGISPKPLSGGQREGLNELCAEAGVPVPAL